MMDWINPTLVGQLIGLALVAMLVLLVVRWIRSMRDRNTSAALADLSQRHRDGELTDEEFAEAKRRILHTGD